MSLLTALLWGTGLLASPGAESTDEPAFGEQVEVRAELPEATSAPLGTHSTVVDPAESLEAPSNLAGLVTEVPAVMENGQGGQLQVFSIRGVSRQRVTNLISDSKITSERRAGVSLSFVDPWLMRSVEVVRGPATTFHGSGALGGVVQVFPRQFDGWVATAGYRSQGNERFISAGTGDGDRWSIGLAYRQADNAEAADGTEINSHFTQYSAVLDTGWGQGNVRYRLTYIPTYGDDIGKANTDFPERTTNYPRERHHLVKFAAVAESGWLVHAFVHAHDLETEVVDESTRNFVTNETFDFGGRWEQQVELGAPTLRVGIQGFGRRGVDATELEEDLDPVDPEEPILLQTIDDARETELGAYAVVDWRALGADWEAGTRVSWIEQQNGDGPTRDDTEVTAHLGVSRMFGRSWELKGSVGTGLRFPSLSERFFSGTTPRGA